MRSQPDSTHPSSPSPRRPHSTRRPAAENAFSPAFLARLRAAANGEPATADEAAFTGPWHLERTAAGDWAVLPAGSTLSTGDRPFATFRDREAALRTAAVLPVRGRGTPFHLGAVRHPAGYPLHRHRDFEGHLDRHDPDLLAWLAVADALARDPWAHAHLLAAAGPQAVARVGRLLARLMETTPEPAPTARAVR